MIKWIKNIFKPYNGSSEHFAHMYQYAKDELACESCDTGTVMGVIDYLSSEMKTNGDARLIRELQNELTLKLKTLTKEASLQLHGKSV